MSDRQNHSNSSSRRDWVEVWFIIDKDADGYPESKSWEGLWATPVGERFQLESVPFYLKNVSRHDVVLAEQGEFLRFTTVAQHGGHNTYRLLMDDATVSPFPSSSPMASSIWDEDMLRMGSMVTLHPSLGRAGEPCGHPRRELASVKALRFCR